MLFKNLVKIASEFLYLTYVTCINCNAFYISVLCLLGKAHLLSKGEAVVFILYCSPQLLYKDHCVPCLLLPILLSALTYCKGILNLRKNQLSEILISFGGSFCLF